MPILNANERFPNRALQWRLRDRTLSFGCTPLLMGIVNVTPDSFSDGGKFFEPQRAIEYGLELAEAGADILDVGGESTRPYSEPVSLQDELNRVEKVVIGLSKHTATPISIDTSKARVAEAALAGGAQIINDVTGLEGDPRMIDVAVDTEAGLCVMHMQGDPQTMQDNPSYDDVVVDIKSYLRARLDRLTENGVDKERICLDPGIGFGKTHEHNLALAVGSGQFHDLRRPILIGHSRKGFIAKLMGDKEADRVHATVGASLALARNGIQVLRVHDVGAHRHALTLFHACGGLEQRG